MLCREFWWTPKDIEEMNQEFYDDALLVLNKESAKIKRDSKR